MKVRIFFGKWEYFVKRALFWKLESENIIGQWAFCLALTSVKGYLKFKTWSWFDV